MPQTGPDLVGAGYPTGFPLTSLLGGYSNQSQANMPVRSNVEWMGISTATSTALVATGVAAIVPVPVTPGTVVTRVGVITTASASAPTHQFAALYAGTGSAPALIAQTTDATSAAIAAGLMYNWTYGTPQTISAVNAPFGFVYAAISVTAPTVCSVLASVAAGATQLNTTFNLLAAQTSTLALAQVPLFLSMTAGSALAGTAAATIASASGATIAPFVFLS